MIDPIQMLQTRVDRTSQTVVAEELQLSVQYLCDVLKRRRKPGPKVLKALGLERLVVYRRVNGSKA